jgi:hypothetical protein
MAQETERDSYTGHGKEDISGEARVAIVDDAIVVTMPGTSYSVTYHKSDAPWLVASDIRDDPKSPIGRFTFRAHAWAAANDKARELDWIV